jgi:hypothetical protein
MKTWLGALGAILLLGGTVGALAAAPQIEVWPPAPDAGTAVRVKVRGEWPDGCVPAITDARLQGRDIVLRAEPRPGPCGKDAQAFETGTETLPLDRLKLAGNGVHRIRFVVAGGPDQPGVLHAFRLFYVGNSPDPGFVPETGFWWPERGGEFDRAGPGLGAQMEVQSGTLSLSVYGFSAAGEPAWSLGAAPMRGHVAEVELSRLSHGAGPFDLYRAPSQIVTQGSAHVELVSPSRATLWFVQSGAEDGGLKLQPVSMVRFRFAQEPAEAWRGRWVVLAERDDGYPTQRIDFSRLVRKKDGFMLLDADGEYRLRCVADAARPNSPPTRCSLRYASGDVLEAAP